MAKPHSFASTRSLSLQELATRLLLVMLFLGSLILVGLGRTENTQAKLANFFAPVGSFIASPVETSTSAMDKFHTAFTHATNAGDLAKENEILRQWKLRAEQLQAENAKLQQLMKVVPALHSKDLTVRVLGSVAGPYSHQMQIAAGSEQGVEQDMAVVDSDGLVGRIISINDLNATIMALTDINSRVAVITGKSREHAVVKGLGDGNLGLFYLPEDTKLQSGEKIYTSGDGGLMPAGILVGTVTTISETDTMVAPAIDRSRLDYVRLLLPAKN